MPALDKEVRPVVLVRETGTLLSMQRGQRHEVTRIDRDSEFLGTLTNSSVENRLTPLDMSRRCMSPIPVQVARSLPQLEQDLLTIAVLTKEQHIDGRHHLKAIVHSPTVAGTSDTQRPGRAPPRRHRGRASIYNRNSLLIEVGVLVEVAQMHSHTTSAAVGENLGQQLRHHLRPHSLTCTGQLVHRPPTVTVPRFRGVDLHPSNLSCSDTAKSIFLILVEAETIDAVQRLPSPHHRTQTRRRNRQPSLLPDLPDSGLSVIFTCFDTAPDREPPPRPRCTWIAATQQQQPIAVIDEKNP